MRVLIVEDVVELANIWRNHLQREGAEVLCARTSDEAISLLSAHDVQVIIVALLLAEGDSAMAVADYAQYRRPDARLIFVSDTDFFSDGSIFEVMGNARALVPRATAPEDLAAMVEHYAEH